MKLVLVKKVDEARATKSFFFKPQTSFNWQAGQYIVLKIQNLERQFTIASSPTEGDLLQITARLKEGSEFKKLLDGLEIGTEVEASGPFGSFILSNHYSLVTNHLFLAGGIGITPFRSMIKYEIDKNLKTTMFLVYSNSDQEFVFKSELDSWQNENENLKIYYHDSSVSGHIDKLKIEELIAHWNLNINSESGYVNSVFWTVGPKIFVDSMEDILEELKIPQDQIKTEKFLGY